MANYINEEILSEAYSHLEVELFHDKVALAKLKHGLTTFFEERAKFLFGDEIRVEIEFEEGSLRTKIKVIGSAALVIVAAMDSYGSFRQSIDYLEKDSTILAQSANLEMIFRTKAAYCDRVNVEKRRGVFGRVNVLLGELDVIKREIDDSKFPTSASSIRIFSGHVERLNNWHKKSEKLFSKLENDETKACVAAGLLEELTQFPSKAPWANELKQESFRAELIKANPELAGNVAAGATQFEETVRYIKKYYKDIVKQSAPENA